MMRDSASPRRPRHRRVERGIYERDVEGGVVYEFNFPNPDTASGTGWDTVKTLAQARRERAKMIAAADRGEPIIRRTNVMFPEVAEEAFAIKSPRLQPRTREGYRAALDNCLLPRFGKLRVSRIDADAIASLIRDLEREGLHAIDPEKWPVYPLGKSSVENYLLPLQAALKLAARRRLIPVNPFELLTEDDRPVAEEKKPPHEWEEGQMSGLLSASAALAAKPEARYDYTPVIRNAGRLGLREGEALGLRWEDFNKDSSFMQVQRQWLRPTKVDGVRLPARYGPTKTPKAVRALPVPPDLRDELIALRLSSKFSKDSDPIFASRTGTPLSHRNVTRRGFEPAAKAAGLDDVTFHDLRDYCASRLISVGFDPVTVADYLGHEDATVTLKRYAHLFHRQRTAEKLRAALVGDEPAKPLQSSHPSPPVDNASQEPPNVAQLRDQSTGGD
jgi:integrase